MQMNLKNGLTALSFTLILAVSCKRGSPDWDTGLVVPIAHGSFTIGNMVPDSLLQTNADGTIKLVYSSTFPGLSTDSIFNIPDTTIAYTYTSPFNFNFNPGQYITPTTPSQTTYALGDLELVFGILTTGMVNVQIQNDLPGRIEVRYTIPSATLNGIPFDTTFFVDPAFDASHGRFVSFSFNLAGYSLDFTGTNYDRINTLSTLFTARIDPNASNSVTATPTDTVAAFNTLTNIHPFYIRGYFGNSTEHVGPDESDFSAFTKVISGNLGLDSLTMTMRLDNYVGMDARLTINNIWSRNSRNNQSVYLNNSQIGTPININRGTLTNTWPPVNPSSYQFQFNNANSNAKALVENMPDKLGYDLTLVTNPLGNVSGNNDFLFTDFGINAYFDVEAPLSFYADTILFADTVSIDFSNISGKEDIGGGAINIYAQNSFPFSSSLQIYMIDANGQIIDSIVSQPNVISAGLTTVASGYTISTGFTSSHLEIPLTYAQTQSLFLSTRLLIKAGFDTNSAPDYVRIYDTNRLDIQLSANFDYHIGN
jgi:hypothetical protein